MAQQVACALPDVSDVLIPQDLDYPGIQLNVNREMAARLGLSAKEVVNNVITALTSNGMIAPSYWVDPKNGNNYLLTVQYPDTQVSSMTWRPQADSAARQEQRRTRPTLENVCRRQHDQHANRG